MRYIFLSFSMIFCFGCTDEFFKYPIIGEQVCNTYINGTWIFGEEWQAEPGLITHVKIDQPKGCKNSTVSLIMTEKNETSVFTWAVKFVRINDRTFANLLISTVDGNAITRERRYVIMELLEISNQKMKLSRVKPMTLINLIDSGQVQGEYMHHTHGSDIKVTSSSSDITSILLQYDLFDNQFTLVKQDR